jgi:hypothetical protein
VNAVTKPSEEQQEQAPVERGPVGSLGLERNKILRKYIVERGNDLVEYDFDKFKAEFEQSFEEHPSFAGYPPLGLQSHCTALRRCHLRLAKDGRIKIKYDEEASKKTAAKAFAEMSEPVEVKRAASSVVNLIEKAKARKLGRYAYVGDLTYAQGVKVGTWVKSQRAFVKDNTIKAIAEAINLDMSEGVFGGKLISEAKLIEILKVENLPYFNAPKSAAPTAAQQVIVKHLIALYEKWEEEVPEELRALLK